MLTFLVQSPDLVNWLVQQAPVVVVMGAVIWWLAKRVNKLETEKDTMAKDVIKLTTLWEEKEDKVEEKNEKVSEQILELLREIKMIVSSKFTSK